MEPKNAEPREPEGQPPERLSVPEIASGLLLTPEQLKTLDDIAAGRAVNGKAPGVREVMAALALKASMSVAKPRERAEGEGERASVVVGCPYCGPCGCNGGTV
jgi:hypothetical protein